MERCFTSINSFSRKKSDADKIADIKYGVSTEEKAARENAGLHYAEAVARTTACEWLNELRKNEKFTVADLYDVITEIHRSVQPEDKFAGKLNGVNMQVNGVTAGCSSFVAPKFCYKTLKMIADGMNTVRNTKGPNLRRTRAVQLSAFAFQMLDSLQLYRNGNTRTARLLADTMLQSFGLPPRKWRFDDKNALANTIGKKIDFDKGAKRFLIDIKESNQLLLAKMQVTQEHINKLEKVKKLFKEGKKDNKLLAAIKKCQTLAQSILREQTGRGNEDAITCMKKQYRSAVYNLKELTQLRKMAQNQSQEANGKLMNVTKLTRLEGLSDLCETIVFQKNKMPQIVNAAPTQKRQSIA